MGATITLRTRAPAHFDSTTHSAPDGHGHADAIQISLAVDEWPAIRIQREGIERSVKNFYARIGGVQGPADIPQEAGILDRVGTTALFVHWHQMQPRTGVLRKSHYAARINPKVLNHRLRVSTCVNPACFTSAATPCCSSKLLKSTIIKRPFG